MAKHHNPKRERFCQEYLKDFCGKAAAIRAGYSPKTAANIAWQILNEDKEAQARIKELTEAATKKAGIEAEDVIREIAKLAFSSLENFVTITDDGSAYVDLRRATSDQMAALTEITTDTYVDGHGEAAREVKKVKIKIADKMRALEKLGLRFGLWKSDAGQVADSIAQAIAQIQERGSTVPVRRDNQDRVSGAEQ